MPFKSESQRKFMFAAEGRGEIPKGTAERWAHHTPKNKKLPEHVSKAAALGFVVGFSKVAGPNASLLENLGNIMGRVGVGATRAAGSAGKGIGQLTGFDPTAMLSHGVDPVIAKKRMKILGTLLSGGAGYGAYRMLRSEPEQPPPQAAQPMPFTPQPKYASMRGFLEGFLTSCYEQGLDFEKAADMLEHGSKRTDAVGESCKKIFNGLSAWEPAT